MAWLNQNPGWGVLIVFGVAFLESLVLVGLLLPGIMILFGIGALIGLGALDMIPVWATASAGALLGDGVSYALGRCYREHLLDIWPFSRYPGVMERGLGFFHDHGAKSVVAGRFIGPLRPIIPAVVGIMGMRPARFLLVDLAACVAWAPSFLVPGIVFGASLEVAAEYTGRLAVVLTIAVCVLWMAWWLLRLVYEPLASRSARWLRHGIRWTRRHPVLGRVAGPLLDPAQPEVLSVSMLGILLVVIFWGLVMLLFLSPFSAQPQALDQAAQSLALSLRNHLADPVMVAIVQLSRWEVTLLASAAVFFWLLGARRQSAAKHWLVAVGGGWLIQLLLGWGLRTTPQVIELLPHEVMRSPSSAMGLSTVVFGFFAVMIAREVKRKHRQWPYLAAALVLTLLALARLYLGLEWLSGELMGLLLGLAWTVIVGIAYRQRALQPFSGALAGLVFYGSVFLLFSWQVNLHSRSETAMIQASMALRYMALEQWWDGGWQELPEERTSAPVAAKYFTGQIVADREHIVRLLSAAAWEEVPDADWLWLIQALNPQPNEASLPLLGRAFQGRSEALLMRKTAPEGARLVTVRLWDSGLRLGADEQVVFLLQVAEEQLVQRLGLFSYWRSAPAGPTALASLRRDLSALRQKQARDGLLLMRLD